MGDWNVKQKKTTRDIPGGVPCATWADALYERLLSSTNFAEDALARGEGYAPELRRLLCDLAESVRDLDKHLTHEGGDGGTPPRPWRAPGAGETRRYVADIAATACGLLREKGVDSTVGNLGGNRLCAQLPAKILPAGIHAYIVESASDLGIAVLIVGWDAPATNAQAKALCLVATDGDAAGAAAGDDTICVTAGKVEECVAAALRIVEFLK